MSPWEVGENRMSSASSENPKIRLFVETPLFPGAQVLLNQDDSHYLINVMRQGAGNEVSLFNGKDGEWAGVITEVDKKATRLEISDHLKSQPKGQDLWLAFAPIKRARIDFVAQKATELGASRLIPIKTERTVVSRVKTSRLLANAKEAAEQSERLTIPEVEDLVSLDALLSGWPEERKLLFCDEEKTGPPALMALTTHDRKPAAHPWGILIGPEGGFSDPERNRIRAHKFCVPATLGPRLLRADTAMLSALSLWQAALGDW